MTEARGGLFCRDCGQVLPETRIPGARETRILGGAYCPDCVRARSTSCRRCGGGLRPEDFEEGRAVVLAGRRYCESCLESAVAGKHGHEAAPEAQGLDDPSISARRIHGRYVPHAEATLAVRLPGVAGFLKGNLLRLWLDVSEGGFRAVLAGDLEQDVRVQGSLAYAPEKASFAFSATVRYLRPAQRFTGCILAGCQFTEPSSALQSFIRRTMAARPVLLPSVGGVTRRPGSSSNALGA